MTVAALPSTITYIEDGATVAFAVPFRFKAASDLTVKRYVGAAGSTLAYGVDYSATGGETDAGGTLTVGLAGAAGALLIIARRTARSQPMIYTTNDRFPAKSHEEALDRLTLIAQEVGDQSDDVAARALTVLPGQSLAPINKSAFVGKFFAGAPDGEIVPASGTGNDPDLRADFAEPDGLSNAGFKQLGTGAVTRDALAKAREFVSITDFGAVDGGSAASTTAALQAAMTYLMDRFPGSPTYFPAGPGEPSTGGLTDYDRRDRRTGEIRFPAGTWKILPEAFSSLAHARANYVGFTFRGHDQNSTIVMLETGGVDSWFFKTTAGTERYQSMTFQDMTIMSDDYLHGNFARVYSTGITKQFMCDRVKFRRLQRILYTEGTGNADLNRFTSCFIEHYGDMLTLDNDQSVEHDFIGCHLRSWGSQVRIKQHGGGNVTIKNGFMDLTWDERVSPAGGNWMFVQDSDASIGQGNCTFTWRDMRVEVEAYTTKAGGTTSTNNAGYAAGVGTVTLQTGGSGAIATGAKVRFGYDPTLYTITSGDADLSNGGSLSFTPNLVIAIPAAITPISVNPPPFGLVKTTDIPNIAFPRIVLDNVNFVIGKTFTIDGSGVVTGEDYRRITAVDLYPRKFVELRNCILLKNFFYNITGSRDTGSPNTGAVLKFVDCFDGITTELPAADTALVNLHSRVTYSGSAGRVITEGMIEHTTGLSTERKLLDADPNWRKSFGREPASTKKITSFKHLSNGWPLAANATGDMYIDLPPGFVALRIFVRKPAVGASTNAYQLHLKVTDRAGAIIASSSLGQFKDLHEIDLSHVDWSAYSRICLCASGVGTDGDFNSGLAYVEYV